MSAPRAFEEWGPWLGARAGEISASVMFLTRLPLPHPERPGGTPAETTLAQASWAFPLAGIVVGLAGALAYALAHRLGLPPWLAAALSVAATLAVTGALHEDGLADTADGFGGGRTAEQKLAIMRDSRIGSYGVCALILSLLLRAGALATLAEPSAVAAALIAAHTAARAMIPAVMFLVPPARTDGLAYAAGAPPAGRVGVSLAIGVLILLISLGFWQTVVAAILLTIVAGLIARLSESQIGGQTGDVLGAIEQVCEIAVLLVAVR